MNVNRFLHETLYSSYYRKHPVEIFQYGYSKVVFQKNRVDTPEKLLASLGFDDSECFSGFERWQPLLEAAVAKVATDGMQGGLSINSGRFLYGLIKGLKPEIVVETGISAGISTSFIYAGLVDNGFGQIYSLELPPESAQVRLEDGASFDWARRGVGWAIPEKLRMAMKGRSSFVLKDVRESLPEIMSEIPHLDLFIHDDLHTPAHMSWEFETVWPHLRPGGVLAADDVNFSWVKFINAHKIDRSALQNIDRFAAIRKC